MSGASDSVFLDGSIRPITLHGDLTIHMNSTAVSLRLDHVTVEGKTRIRTGRDRDLVELVDTVFTRKSSIFTGRGDDTLRLRNSRFCPTFSSTDTLEWNLSMQVRAGDRTRTAICSPARRRTTSSDFSREASPSCSTVRSPDRSAFSRDVTRELVSPNPFRLSVRRLLPAADLPVFVGTAGLLSCLISVLGGQPRQRDDRGGVPHRDGPVLKVPAAPRFSISISS
jgi:hypothetical protein